MIAMVNTRDASLSALGSARPWQTELGGALNRALIGLCVRSNHREAPLGRYPVHDVGVQPRGVVVVNASLVVRGSLL